MLIELKTAVQVRLPDSSKFIIIKAGSKANYSSNRRDEDLWVHRFTTWHQPSGTILQHIEVIRGNEAPKWL